MSLYNNIFDAHAHYDDKWFDDDRFELLENIHTKGVCGIVNNAVDLETAKTCIEYAEKYDFMYAAVGFHPENLENIPDNYLEQLAQLSKHKKVVAIGETGLDYHWDIPKDLQKRVFEEQIRLSLDLEMPLWSAVVLGAVGAVLGEIGDLSFSVIKRQTGIKDYGHIFPGHGGVLDRFDSVLFVAPFAELLFRVIW